MSFGSLVVVQPSLMDRTAFTGGGVRWAPAGSESVVWQPSLGMGVVLSDGKSLERTPRLSSESYDKYIAWTELLHRPWSGTRSPHHCGAAL